LGVAAAILPLVLAGCVAGLVYDRLDVVASWYVASYVSLDKAQDRQLRSFVLSTLEWNRQTQFDRLGALLRELERDSRGPMAADTIQQRFQQMSETWDELVSHVAPNAAHILATLRRDQIEELFASLEKANLEYAEEYAGDDSAKRVAHRQRAAIKAIQRFTGTLDESQRALVRLELAGLHDLTEQWLAHRRTWQAHLRTLLEQRGGTADFARELEGLLLDGNRFDDPAYRSASLENQRRVFAMLADVSQTLTTSQHRHLSEKISEYASMLDDIGRRPAASTRVQTTAASLPLSPVGPQSAWNPPRAP
jgi:hypothetical protein